MSKTVGVIIGRFQTNEIHEGHIQLIDHVKTSHDAMIVMLGVRQTPANKTYPLDYQTRELMVRKYCGDVVIVPIVDHSSDEIWSRNVDNMVDMIYPGREAILYGGRDSFISHYKGKHKTKELYFAGVSDEMASSAIRKKIASKPIESPDFRAGIIYAIENLMPRIYCTVDIGMVNVATGKVLMGKKPGEKTWRFPGGFVDRKDPNFETSARRELFEETGMTCEGRLASIGTYSIDDWRNTDDTKIMTTFFMATYSHGAPKAGDDLAEVEWIDIDEKLIDNINPNHQALFKDLIAWIGPNDQIFTKTVARSINA